MSFASSPPKNGQALPVRGFLPLSDDNPLSLHGNSVLNTLLRSRSNASLHIARRPSSVIGDELPADEEVGERPLWRHHREGEDPAHERRASQILNKPQMRSMRLIGNSNPRYNWKKYWKTEDELRKMKKPMFVLRLITFRCHVSLPGCSVTVAQSLAAKAARPLESGGFKLIPRRVLMIIFTDASTTSGQIRSSSNTSISTVSSTPPFLTISSMNITPVAITLIYIRPYLKSLRHHQENPQTRES